MVTSQPTHKVALTVTSPEMTTSQVARLRTDVEQSLRDLGVRADVYVGLGDVSDKVEALWAAEDAAAPSDSPVEDPGE